MVNVEIKNYILKEFNILKLAEPILDVAFTNESLKENNLQHGQLKCLNLIFPFAKDGYKPIPLPISEATTIVEANPDNGIKEVLEITLDSTCLTLDYAPGDTIAILPHNLKTEVDFLLSTTQLLEKADQPCQVLIHAANPKKNFKLPHIPQVTTPRELLRDILNIRSVPKKQFLRSLAHYCTEPVECNFLNCLASKEGSKYYNELLLEKGLLLCDLLKLCASCQPTLSLLAEHFPRLLPRPYSIANSPETTKDSLKIIYSVLNERPGVTTSMLTEAAKCVNETTVRILTYPRQVNNFRYTSDDVANNQILIAIGTGLAPFLGFLEHKAHLSKKSIKTTGDTWLFVGAATELAVPQRKRLLEWQKIGVLQRYFESLSRVERATHHYVQEQFKAHSKELIEFLLAPNTVVYICADGAKISQSIEEALITCIYQELQLPTMEEAKEMLKQFRFSGKYREDLWT